MCASVLSAVMNKQRGPDPDPDPEPEPEFPPDIRPPGRERRERQAYTMSCEVRETNFFERSLKFDDDF